MERSILFSNDKKSILTPKRLDKQSSSKRTASDSKSRFSDRFIPSSINKNLLNDFETTCFPEIISKKSEQNYMKLLQTEILEEKTPSKISLYRI
jgi:hypothetical protein